MIHTTQRTDQPTTCLWASRNILFAWIRSRVLLHYTQWEHSWIGGDAASASFLLQLHSLPLRLNACLIYSASHFVPSVSVLQCVIELSRRRGSGWWCAVHSVLKGKFHSGFFVRKRRIECCRKRYKHCFRYDEWFFHTVLCAVRWTSLLHRFEFGTRSITATTAPAPAWNTPYLPGYETRMCYRNGEFFIFGFDWIYFLSPYSLLYFSSTHPKGNVAYVFSFFLVFREIVQCCTENHRAEIFHWI